MYIKKPIINGDTITTIDIAKITIIGINKQLIINLIILSPKVLVEIKIIHFMIYFKTFITTILS